MLNAYSNIAITSLHTSFFRVSRCITIRRALLPDIDTLSSCWRLTISGGFSALAVFSLAFTSAIDDDLEPSEDDALAPLEDDFSAAELLSTGAAIKKGD